MYSVRRKIGDIIAVWGDSNGQGNVSTTAAMVASRLAMEGEINKKVLMLSTDKGPYDGVTILNPVVQDNYSMDNLILLAAAGGLKEEEVFLAYTIKVGKNLDVMHSTNDFKRLSSDAVRAYHKILDFASMIYDYIVVDVSGKISSMSEMILSVADVVLLCVSQNMKHLTLLKESSILTQYPPLKEKNIAVVLTRYSELPYLDVKQIGKYIGCTDMFVLSEDMGIHRAVSECTLDNFVPGLYDSGGRLSFLKKKGSDITGVELDAIVNSIYSLHAQKEASKIAEREADE